MAVTAIQRLTYWAPCCVAVLICLWVVKIFIRYIRKRVFTTVFPPMMERITIAYNKEMNHFKVQLFHDLSDLKEKLNADTFTVLELGAGTGANFQYYPAGTTVIPVEPLPNFNSYLMSNAKNYPDLSVKDMVIAYGENMQVIPDGSVDVVVSTLVLCTVRDMKAAIKEVRRVLKPNGKFYFMEHVYCEDQNSWIQIAQRLFNPVWKVFQGGCSLTCTTWRDIDSGGFSTVNYKKFSAPLKGGGKLISPHVMGYAVK